MLRDSVVNEVKAALTGGCLLRGQTAIRGDAAVNISHFDNSDPTNIFMTRASLPVACLLLRLKCSRRALCWLFLMHEVVSGGDMTYNLTTYSPRDDNLITSITEAEHRILTC